MKSSLFVRCAAIVSARGRRKTSSTSEVWGGIDWGNAPYKMNENSTKLIQHIIECVEWLIKNKAVDSDRVYVAGTSMGSMGMWDLVCRRPDLFAAGVACCGGFDAEQAKKIKHIPFRIFHGDRDPWIPYDGSKAMFDSLKKAKCLFRKSVKRRGDSRIPER